MRRVHPGWSLGLSLVLVLIIARPDRCRAVSPPAEATAAGLTALRATADSLRAAEAFARTDSLAEPADPPAEAELGDLLVLQARAAIDTGDFAAAADLYARAYAILARHWGPDHPAVVPALLGLADEKSRHGDEPAASGMYVRAIAILSRALPPEHPALADALRRQGCHFADAGDYHRAEESLRRALATYRAVFGERHIECAVTMTRLADVLKMLGYDAESNRLVREAVQIAEATTGPHSPQTAVTLVGLAHALLAKRSNAEAEELFRRALAIYETAHASPHPETARVRGALGRCLEVQLRFAAAEEEMRRAVAEATAIFGEDSYEVALEQRRLGLLMIRLRRVAEGMVILEHSHAILERQFGPQHPYLCMGLKGLVEGELLLGDVAAARTYAAQAVATYRHVFGGVHSEVVMTLRLAALVELIDENWNAAFANAIQACEIALALQEKIYSGATDHDALQYSGWARQTLESTLLGMLELAPAVSDSLLARVFSLAVRTHGQVLDRMAQRHRYLDLARENAAVARICREYLAASQRVAFLELMLAGDAPADSLAHLREARARKEKAERILWETSERFRFRAAFQGIPTELSPAGLARALEGGTTLVQFVRYSAYEMTPYREVAGEVRYAAWRPERRSDHYAAFCFWQRRDAGQALTYVDLGPVETLDSLITRYREIVDATPASPWPSARDEAEYRSVARSLYDRLWAPLSLADPIEPRTSADGSGNAAGTVLLVPTGQFHLLDFNTLLDPTGELVIENWRLHYLSSARDLLRFTRDPPPCDNEGLLAVGDPSAGFEPYDDEPNDAKPNDAKPKDATPSDGEVAALTRVPRSRNGEPPPCGMALKRPAILPGAAAEARSIAALFGTRTEEPVHLLIGAEADETTVKRLLPQHRIVHLATHGFFCEEAGRTYFIPERDRANPLLLSGLILTTASADEDGLLTAEEVVGYDLRNVEWVVLSACGSALGRVLPGEGLFGLRRAFEVAGARTVVTALWSIRDTVARDLMERIYNLRFAGRATVDAVRDAQLERLRDHRRRRNRIHPVLWGGIVAEGDWR